ncbi:alpha/beta fold hydrolase [Streptomyces sp. NPDC049910]|uniref:alpha/beta fold hydrolase n=1 Tax=Streptomyces sp. NPDC049910 TaxID=3155278 RepID=UPI003444A9E3
MRKIPEHFTNRDQAVTMAERTGAFTHLVSSLEILTTEEDRAAGGFNDWRIVRDHYAHFPAPVRRALDSLGNPVVTRALHVGRVAAAASLVASTSQGRWRACADAYLALSSVALHPRHMYGTDGSDQLSLLVQSSMAVARAGRGNPRLADACLWFVALQSTLSYAVSGLVKLPGPDWRSGTALPGIMRTENYGDRDVYGLMRTYPRAAKVLSHGVLALECGFPLVYFRQGRYAPALLTAAGAFHLVNTRVMGLGRFLPAFLSTYPAILYTVRESKDRNGSGPARSDGTPRLAGGLLGAAALAAAGSQWFRRRRVLAGDGSERHFTAPSGNRLAYHLTEPLHESDADRPVLVCLTGLMATAARWANVRRGLGSDFPVLTYDRAGYGGSSYEQADPYTLRSSVDDLAALIRAVCPGRPVVLVGHSLGGYLALRCLRALPGQVVGTVLLDPSHPGELHRSAAQASGARRLGGRFLTMPTSLRCGLGALLPEPGWLSWLPPDARRRVLDQYRDAGLWQTAVREWKATHTEFLNHDGSLSQVSVPLLLIAAGKTHLEDGVNAKLHQEIVDSSPRGRLLVVDGVGHGELVTGPEPARRVAEHVAAFAASLGPEGAV